MGNLVAFSKHDDDFTRIRNILAVGGCDVSDSAVQAMANAIRICRYIDRAEALEEAADAVGEVGDHADAGAYINAIRALKEEKHAAVP